MDIAGTDLSLSKGKIIKTKSDAFKRVDYLFYIVRNNRIAFSFRKWLQQLLAIYKVAQYLRLKPAQAIELHHQLFVSPELLFWRGCHD